MNVSRWGMPCALALSLVSGWAGAACDPRSVSSTEQQVIHAYVAYYGRVPDAAGLAWWTQTLEESGGELSSIMQAFGTSEEFVGRFGGLSDETLINNLYQQAFGRDADDAGLAFYLGELEAGRMSLQTIALQILAGAQNEDATTIQNRSTVSAHGVTLFEDEGVELSESELADALKNVTEAEATAEAACETLGKQVSEKVFAEAVASEPDNGGGGETCDNGSSQTEPVKQLGYVTGVSGLAYVSESEETLNGVKKTISGETSETGAYEYYEVCGAASVTTYCMGVKKGCGAQEQPTGINLVGGSPGPGVIGRAATSEGYKSIEEIVAETYAGESSTTQQMISRRVYQLLFSLDEDGQTENGVHLTRKARTEAERLAEGIDFTEDRFEQSEAVLELVKRVANKESLVSETVVEDFAQRIDEVKDGNAKRISLAAFLAYLGRPLDPVSKDVWQGRLKDQPGQLTDLVGVLASSSGYVSSVKDLTVDEVIDALTVRLFNRSARNFEKAYWVALFEREAVSLGSLPATMMNAPYLADEDKHTLSNKIAAMDVFYTLWDGLDYDSALDEEIEKIIGKVGDSPESVAEAEEALLALRPAVNQPTD